MRSKPSGRMPGILPRAWVNIMVERMVPTAPLYGGLTGGMPQVPASSPHLWAIHRRLRIPRLASAARTRLFLACNDLLQAGPSHPSPRVRLNKDALDALVAFTILDYAGTDTAGFVISAIEITPDLYTSTDPTSCKRVLERLEQKGLAPAPWPYNEGRLYLLLCRQ